MRFWPIWPLASPDLHLQRLIQFGISAFFQVNLSLRFLHLDIRHLHIALFFSQEKKRFFLLYTVPFDPLLSEFWLFGW